MSADPLAPLTHLARVRARKDAFRAYLAHCDRDLIVSVRRAWEGRYNRIRQFVAGTAWAQGLIHIAMCRAELRRRGYRNLSRRQPSKEQRTNGP